MEKTVKLFTIQGQTLNSISSSAANWGELKAEINQFTTDQKMDNYNFEELKAVVKGSKVSLEVDDAILPDQDFTVFLLQRRGKAGGLGKKRAAIYEEVHEILDADPAAINYFSANFPWTNKSNSVLRDLIEGYVPTIATKEVVESPKASGDVAVYIAALETLVANHGSKVEKLAYENLRITLGVVSEDELAFQTEVKELAAEACQLATQLGNQVLSCKEVRELEEA